MSDAGVSRRAALGAAGVVVAGGVAGYVAGRNTDAAKALAPANSGSGGQGGGYGAPAGSSGGKKLTAVDAIPDGGGVIVGSIVVTRQGAAVRAFSAVCPHQGCHVDRVADGTIDRPCHGSRFDVTTGKVVAGPAPRGLAPVAVTVSNGEVITA